MSTREVTSWVAVCDRCGGSLADHDEPEYCYGRSPEQAADMALGYWPGWERTGDKLYCPLCWPHHLNPPEPHP